MTMINGRRIIDVLSGLDEKLLEYVGRKRDLKNQIRLLMESREHLGVEGDLALKNFLYTFVFTNRRQITEFIKAYSKTLSPMELKILRIIHQTPMEWLIFEIDEYRGGYDFVVNDPWLNDFRLFVFQESIWEVMEDSENETFAALVFKLDGESYTFTLPLYFPTLQSHHLLQFFEIVDPESLVTKGINAFIRKNYLAFFLLYNNYADWEASNPDRLPHFYWGEFHLDFFDYYFLLGEWHDRETAYGFNQYDYKGIDPDEIKEINLSPEFYKKHNMTKKKFWDEATHPDLRIYWDEITERGYFRAHSYGGPTLIREVLEASFNLDGFELQWSMPYNLFSWITTFGTPRAPWSFIIDDIEAYDPDTFERHFEDKIVDDIVPENVGAYFTHIGRAYFLGEQFDWVKLAQEYDIPRRLAETIYDSLLVFSGEEIKTTPIPEEEDGYRLNYPKPDDEAMYLFKRPLDHEDSYFLINEGRDLIPLFNTYTNNSFTVFPTSAGLSLFFAQLFEDEFGEREGVFISNALFYILASTTDATFSVRGLALEVIHLYGHIFLKTLNLEMEEFVNIFSRFTLSKLCSTAILEVVEKSPSFNEVVTGNYRVKTTQFFKRFIELS